MANTSAPKKGAHAQGAGGGSDGVRRIRTMCLRLIERPVFSRTIWTIRSAFARKAFLWYASSARRRAVRFLSGSLGVIAPPYIRRGGMSRRPQRHHLVVGRRLSAERAPGIHQRTA